MSYSAFEKEGNRVILKSGFRPRLAFPALMLMSLVTAVAAGVSFSGGLYPPHAFIFAGVTLLLFFGGLLHRRGRSLRPEGLEFNNDAGDVYVLQGDSRTAVMPYGRIRSFLIRRKSRGRWTVFMIMKDGGYWDLAEFALRRTAVSFQGRLARNIRLRTRDSLKPLALPEHVQLTEDAGVTRIRWREDLSFQTFLTASGLLPGLLLVIAGLFLEARPDAARAWWTWAAGAAGLLQLVVMVAAVRLRKSEHGIDIHGDSVAYIADARETAAAKASPEQWPRMLREDIHGVQYSFDPDHGVPKLFLLNREQAERLDRMRVGDVRLREIPRMFWLEKKIFKIPLTGLQVMEAEALRGRLANLLNRREDKRKKR